MMLSPRLKAILGLLDEPFVDVLADIGTDHAYLPIEAVRAGLCQRAIACDINVGPLKIADFNIREAGLSEKIETRLGDGLQPLNPGEADCITIAGMGGMKIIGILDSKKIQNAKLILQPQHDLEELRRNLHSQGYEIHEKLAKESERFYVIIHAQKADNIQRWTDKQYFLGNFCNTSYLQQRRDKIERYINSINDANTRRDAEKKLEWIKSAQCAPPERSEEA